MAQIECIKNWSPPAGDISLGAAEVHVWMSRLSLPEAVLTKIGRWLSGDERERAARFRHDKHRNNFIVGRAMMRGVLGRYVDAEPDQMEFKYLAHGKPQLAGEHATSHIEFNLSHSGDVALCAVTLGETVGVDVERVRDLRDMQGLANRFFSAHEARELDQEPSDRQLESFFRCWTRKEAYVKAIGQGITCPLDSFAVTLTADAPPQLLHIDEDETVAANWSMVTIMPQPYYVGALATPRQITALRSWVWSP